MNRQPAFLVLCSATMLFLSGFSLLHRNKSMQQSLHVRKSIVYSVVIDKSNYQLKVFDENGWLLTYPVVFGTSEMTDKMMEGDRRTPEGHFRIIAKKFILNWGIFFFSTNQPQPIFKNSTPGNNQD